MTLQSLCRACGTESRSACPRRHQLCAPPLAMRPALIRAQLAAGRQIDRNLDRSSDSGAKCSPRGPRVITGPGQCDDIYSVGPTVAAQDLCAGLFPNRLHHHMQVEVGHYEVCSGQRGQSQIAPLLRNVIHASALARVSSAAAEQACRREMHFMRLAAAR